MRGTLATATLKARSLSAALPAGGGGRRPLRGLLGPRRQRRVPGRGSPSPQLPQRSPAPGTCCCEQTSSAGSGTPAVCTLAPGAASAPLRVPRTASPALCLGRILRLKDALAAPLLSGGGETSFPRVPFSGCKENENVPAYQRSL